MHMPHGHEETKVMIQDNILGIETRTSWFSIYGATVVCLLNLLLLKVMQEALVTSSPIVMDVFFGWHSTHVGLIFCVLGLLVIPVNDYVGKLSRYYSDRRILILSEIVAIFGMLFMIKFGFFYDDMPIVQYIFGLSLTFIACQTMEGVSTSILSKCMPRNLAKGILNSGFLST